MRTRAILLKLSELYLIEIVAVESCREDASDSESVVLCRDGMGLVGGRRGLGGGGMSLALVYEK